MHDPIICRFCKKAPQHKPLQEASALSMDIYFCFDCNTEYSAYCGKQNIYYSMYAHINGKIYRWSTGGVTSYLYYVGAPGIPGQKVNKEIKLVMSLNSDLLEMTPENIQSKIKTILLFL